MNDERIQLGEAQVRIIEGLIEEHVRVDCNLIPIDDRTWAIHGSIAVDGNVILAEFDSVDAAEAALERIVAAEMRATRSEGALP